MNHRRREKRERTRRRAGNVTLLFLGSLLVVLGVTAVAVDRLWVDNASVELQTSAEASALAAARALAGDETLAEEIDWETVVARAMAEAQSASQLNPVVGEPLKLRRGPEGDVWFGQDVLDRDTGQSRFVFTDWRPSVVKVRAERTSDTANPVGMLLGGLFGVHTANVSTIATVTVDNHVLGIRPRTDYPAPALPIALLRKRRGNEDDGANDRRPTEPLGADASDLLQADVPTEAETAPQSATWVEAIDGREGTDDFGWDDVTKQVVREPDGLPEMIVRSLRIRTGPRTDEDDESNVQLLDFANDFRFSLLGEQIARGLTADHLRDFGGELLLDGRHHRMRCTAAIDERVIAMLEREIGQPRIAFLYESHEPGRHGEGTCDVTRFVGVRLLAVRYDAGRLEAVLQPAAVVTKTAIPFADWRWTETNRGFRGTGPNDDRDDAIDPTFANRYVRHLTVNP